MRQEVRREMRKMRDEIQQRKQAEEKQANSGRILEALWRIARLVDADYKEIYLGIYC